MKDRLAHGPEENPRADAAVECDRKPSTVRKVRFCVRSAEAEIAHASEGEANNDEENAEPEKQQERTEVVRKKGCLLYTSPSPRDGLLSRMPSSA